MMFRSARIKLTLQYVLIVVFISGTLSLWIYGVAASVIDYQPRVVEQIWREEEKRFDLFHGLPRPLRLLSENARTAKLHLIAQLLRANVIIVVVFSTAGYFFAGKTLRPIEEAMEEQKRFIADASHEFRTPLTAMKTSMEVVLRDRKMTVKDAKKSLRSSLEEVDDLQLLASSLLSLSQYQKSKSLEFAQLNLKESALSAYKKVQPLVKEKDIDLTIKVEDVILEAEESGLVKMVVILLDNAVKYTPKQGTVTLIVGRDRRHAFIRVEDTGIGIAGEDISHIFDRFYRVDQSRSKTKVPGFGLGLSMAKNIVDLHRGSIDVSSVPGRGTTFTIKLPLK